MKARNPKATLEVPTGAVSVDITVDKYERLEELFARKAQSRKERLPTRATKYRVILRAAIELTVAECDGATPCSILEAIDYALDYELQRSKTSGGRSTVRKTTVAAYENKKAAQVRKDADDALRTAWRVEGALTLQELAAVPLDDGNRANITALAKGIRTYYSKEGGFKNWCERRDTGQPHPFDDYFVMYGVRTNSGI